MPTVFSCVASRNKQGKSGAVDKGLGYPTLLEGLKPAGPKSNVSCGPPLREASARAALRAAGARPKALPRVRLTAAPLSLRRARGRRFLAESRYSLSAYSSSPPAEVQRAPSSCSPPRGVAANCAARRAARATPFTAQGCRVRPRRAPHAPLKRRPCRGRRPKGRKSTAQSPAQTKPQALPRVRLTAAPLSLRRVFARLRDSTISAHRRKS